MTQPEPPSDGVQPTVQDTQDRVGREPRGGREAEPGTVEVLEEALSVSKRDVLRGTVRVATRTEVRNEVAEVSLDRHLVDVTRVPVGQVVDAAPPVRTEDGVTIVPVLEERAAVVKQLYLVEELHIRHRVETEVERVPVRLRRQTASVERLDADGKVTDDPNR